MVTIAQKIYQGLADEKDAQSDDAMVDGKDPIKVSLAKDIESKYEVSFDNFCKVVDTTCEEDFAGRLAAFVSEFEQEGSIDKNLEVAKSEMQAWSEGTKTFTIEKLIKFIEDIDPFGDHTKLIPELFRFNCALGSRFEDSAAYYAKVLYPIYLLKEGFIKMN